MAFVSKLCPIRWVSDTCRCVGPNEEGDNVGRRFDWCRHPRKWRVVAMLCVVGYINAESCSTTLGSLSWGTTTSAEDLILRPVVLSIGFTVIEQPRIVLHTVGQLRDPRHKTEYGGGRRLHKFRRQELLSVDLLVPHTLFSQSASL